MTQYSSLNEELSDSQLNKLKSAIKNETDVVLRLLWNMIGNSDDETDFSLKLLVFFIFSFFLSFFFSKLLSIHIKLSKTQLSKMTQSGGFLDKFLGPLLKPGLPLIKNVLQALTRRVLIPLGLTAAASAADAGIH